MGMFGFGVILVPAIGPGDAFVHADDIRAAFGALEPISPAYRDPKARLAVCEACDYDIRENYIREHRLCFPTVGIRASGKTHWLLMLYRQIKNLMLNALESGEWRPGQAIPSEQVKQ